MDIITVNCTLSLNESGLGAIKFTFEDIPFVIYARALYAVVDDELEKIKVHVNDDHIICSVYDLKMFDRRRGRFEEITKEKYESSDDRTERIKRELDDQYLKLSAPRNIFMKFIKDTNASLNMAELQRLYPDEYAQWINGDTSESPVSIIYEKKDRMFPSSGGRRKNGRRCRRTRQKTKRVKRAKLMKRSRKANHIKNVKH
jgi:hypothetical protein